MKHRINRPLIAYTISHFCVDFTCFFILFYGFHKEIQVLETVSLGFLVYNVIAFGLQPILGYLCDRNSRIPIGSLGCLLVMIGLITLRLPWASLLFCSFGNACFHVGGGIQSLKYSRGRMADSGIFVSTGAMGVVLGTMLGQMENAPLIVPSFLMAGSILLILKYGKSKEVITGKTAVKSAIDTAEKTTVDTAEKTSASFSDVSAGVTTTEGSIFQISSHRAPMLILLLVVMSIMIRSYVGSLIPNAWKTSMFLMLLPGISAVIGKAAGGILGDRFGARRVGVITLIVSIPFLLFGSNIAWVSVIGIVLFNMTMPITLCVLASELKHGYGLAFGITTLALLCGNIPTFFLRVPAGAAMFFMPLFIGISAICIYLTTNNKRGKDYGRTSIPDEGEDESYAV